MYSLSYTGLFVMRIKKLTFFGREVWGSHSQSSIFSQIADKSRRERLGLEKYVRPRES